MHSMANPMIHIWDNYVAIISGPILITGIISMKLLVNNFNTTIMINNNNNTTIMIMH